jgi:hypothetical protein
VRCPGYGCETPGELPEGHQVCKACFSVLSYEERKILRRVGFAEFSRGLTEQAEKMKLAREKIGALAGFVDVVEDRGSQTIAKVKP